MDKKKKYSIDKAIDSLTEDTTAEDLLNYPEFLKEFQNRNLERALEAEMPGHQGDEKHSPEMIS
ncbi:MAG: hypothetical protein GY780_01820 [bacterium]|nr:hypothetical protein [bacterium]